MTTRTPVDSVVELLTKAGYFSCPTPVEVTGVAFDFDALLLGTGRSIDVVVVADMAYENETRLRQKVEALGRALDVAGSRRSLTVVTVGPEMRSDELHSLAQTARVLPTAPGSRNLEDSLAILLPLAVGVSTASRIEPFREIDEWAASEPSVAPVSTTVSVAARGTEAVERELNRVYEVALRVSEGGGL